MKLAKGVFGLHHALQRLVSANQLSNYVIQQGRKT